jgi:hypothetical protein
MVWATFWAIFSQTRPVTLDVVGSDLCQFFGTKLNFGIEKSIPNFFFFLPSG